MHEIDLGQLELRGEIGKGGYGTVYDAVLPMLDDLPVAVKVLDSSPFQDPTALDRFVQEAKILLSLRHPHIISIYGCGVHERKPYILMEKFNGIDLQKARNEFRHPTPAEILPFVRRVASALAHAHRQDVLHRDITPTNLMTRTGDARVIDFGIARIIDPEGRRFTRSGGTPMGGAFVAPELTTTPRLEDPRSDIYSLAACWYWMLTGQTPSGRNWESALTSIEGVSADYAAVVFKALDQIGKRFATMEDLENEIRALEIGKKTKSADELVMDDDSMLILGTIFENEDSDGRGVAVYALEKEIGGAMSRLRLKLTVQRLIEGKFVELKEAQDWSDTYLAYFVTSEGHRLVKQHEARIETLLAKTQQPRIETDDSTDDPDVPF